ncbi:MAG: hypothetical protein BGP24_19065 [Lysobacterales bacterium 69-70]|nr:MAG: hypothetical protein ABS97_19730 [Xanthomonadaceae bacterium SCN 69-320]ODV16693.1 MAG: hypothetical protein ABT27_19445 [Xanthomonadaceae bacterium SCN 69-25]OJY96889.1 MAG: hypothetical protein BGP24_19065 [Xanthomonadales bacterium 69-70]
MAQLCRNDVELAQSVRTFARSDPRLQLDALGTVPRHFVHLREGGKDYFGLSKFCAYAGLRLADYRGKRVHKIRPGGATRKRIQTITGKKFIELDKVSARTRAALLNWLDSLPPGGFNRDHLHVLELDGAAIDQPEASESSGKGPGRRRRKPVMTVEALEERLRQQKKIGKAGEKVALAFERKRLKDDAKVEPGFRVVHEAAKFVDSGYDIRSVSSQGTRYIEVKATTGDIESGFYLSQGELNTMKRYGNEAFLYLVELEKSLKTGRVFVVRNPALALEQGGAMTPKLFHAVLPVDRQD